MARTMALCSLPRTNPGNRLQYKRVNGPYKLIMTATGDHKLPLRQPAAPVDGLALDRSGTDPKPRVLILGDSLAEFMRALGIYNSGGNPQIHSLRNQMRRLISAGVALSQDCLIYEDERGAASASSLVADRTEVLVERTQARRAESLGE